MIDEDLLNANILIVDDQPANVAVLEGFLQYQGYENIRSTTDPREVLQLFATFEPDIILLDLMMPYFSGFEVMDMLKPLIPEGTFLPILVLTADATSDAKQRALSGGASDFITKPFDLVEVGLRIRNLLYTNYLQQQLLGQNQILEQRVQERTIELIQANDALTLARDKAEASDKLKTSFIQNVSHEIRTPLNGILGFSALLTDSDLSQEEKDEFSNLLRASSQRLINTVTDYMDISLLVSNLMEIHPKQFDVGRLLFALKDEFATVCTSKDIEIVIQCPSENQSLLIENDEELLSKVLRHLIDNALKFSRKGVVVVDFDYTDDKLQFSIKDEGLGIATESQERVFEVFMQEDPSTTRGHEGSGLGLSICKGIVKLLGGDIYLKSEKGLGTTISFAIPYNGSKASAKQNEPSPVNEKSKDPVVLIAEDDSSNRIFFELLIRKHCKRLHLAENGREAVELCKANPDIDLVIMDIKMPVMDGIAATQLIRAFNKEVKIVAVTAYGKDQELNDFESLGFNDVLPKPLEKDDFLKRLLPFGIRN